jgi:signal peptidase I
MQGVNKNPVEVDPIGVLSRLLKQTTVIIVIVVAVKMLCVDIIAVKGNQMAPAIVNGDRLLTLRLPYLPLIRNSIGPSRRQPVIFSYPFSKKRGCLRVAGVAGDTITVDSGVAKNPHCRKPLGIPGRKITSADLLPPDFSPRDFMPAMILPRPGTTLLLDSLDLPMYFSAISMIRQENPSSTCSLAVHLEIDGAVAADYFITDFVLYKGALNALPDSLRYDWFFWYRLKKYLHQVYPDRIQRLLLSFSKGGSVVKSYTVRKKFLFLIADNWSEGRDSRYFGPVVCSRVIGRPLAVLWSFSAKQGFNMKRLGRFIP